MNVSRSLKTLKKIHEVPPASYSLTLLRVETMLYILHTAINRFYATVATTGCKCDAHIIKNATWIARVR